MATPNVPPAGRDAELTVLRGPELGRIDVLFATIHPGWDRRVTVWWTDGADEHWGDHTPLDEERQPKGETTWNTHVWETARSMDAEVLINLRRVSAVSRQRVYGQPAGGNVEEISLYTFRQRAFDTLCHELLHVVQNWSLGPETFMSRYGEATLRAQLGDPFNLSPPSHFGATSIFDEKRGYFRNPFEISAMQYGKDRVSAHIQALNDGKFDDILPIERMRAMVTEWSKANPVPSHPPGKGNRIKP
jgi:hypothetical protein